MSCAYHKKMTKLLTDNNFNRLKRKISEIDEENHHYRLNVSRIETKIPQLTAESAEKPKDIIQLKEKFIELIDDLNLTQHAQEKELSMKEKLKEEIMIICEYPWRHEY